MAPPGVVVSTGPQPNKLKAGEEADVPADWARRHLEAGNLELADAQPGTPEKVADDE